MIVLTRPAALEGRILPAGSLVSSLSPEAEQKFIDAGTGKRPQADPLDVLIDGLREAQAGCQLAEQLDKLRTQAATSEQQAEQGAAQVEPEVKSDTSGEQPEAQNVQPAGHSIEDKTGEQPETQKPETAEPSAEGETAKDTEKPNELQSAPIGRPSRRTAQDT